MDSVNYDYRILATRELPMKAPTTDTLVNRLNKHPSLKARVEAILDVAENTHGDLIRADEAEQRAIEQVRQ